MKTLTILIAALDGLALGGLIAVVLVHRLLLTIMARLVTGDAQGEILNVLEHLLPYIVGYAAATLVMLWTSLLVWLATRLRKPISAPRLEISP